MQGQARGWQQPSTCEIQLCPSWEWLPALWWAADHLEIPPSISIPHPGEMKGPARKLPLHSITSDQPLLRCLSEGFACRGSPSTEQPIELPNIKFSCFKSIQQILFTISFYVSSSASSFLYPNPNPYTSADASTWMWSKTYPCPSCWSTLACGSPFELHDVSSWRCLLCHGTLKKHLK